MTLPTESQWAQVSALWAELQPLSAPARKAALQDMHAQGAVDPQVLSLVALQGALPPDPIRDRSQERLGAFTLEEPLGAGGMGIVYRAQQQIGPATRSVAVKLIQPALLQPAPTEVLAHFLAELRALVTLQHAHIARIYDGGIYEDPRTHEQLPYLAMELVREGQALTAYCTAHALPMAERLTLVLQVCRALQYAHEHRILHCDLKPANILVDCEGHPFVIDFGLAQVYDELVPGASLVFAGTPAYMSPEQAADGFGALSVKTDVYALGLLLHEVLTGELPYRLPHDGSFEAMRRVITVAVPRPLGAYDAAYQGELETLVAMALAKRPVDRLPLAALRSRLERYLQRLPPDSGMSWHATSPAPRDLSPQFDRGDYGIVRSTARPRVETETRTPTARMTPMPEEHHNERITFVGRRQYLDWFETCFQDTRTGHPRVVFLTGEAGVGKTRLLRELRNAAMHQGLQVWGGRCYEDLPLPYLPIIEALLPLLEQLPTEGQSALAQEAALLQRFFHRIHGAPSGLQALSAEEAEQEKLLVFLAVSRILIALAQHQPLVLLFDDLHWADSSSLDLLGYVVFTVAERALRELVPLTLLGTLRPVAPEERLARLLARVQREEVCHLLDLPCLHEAEIYDLLQSLGMSRPSHQLVVTVQEATQGNPLFIQEVAQYLRQQDLLHESGGALVTTVAPADLRLPEELTSVLARRIQDLSVPCQRLLMLTACLGERFAFDTLAAVSGESEESLLTLLEEGMQHRLLLSRERAFQFAHPLVRHVCYNVPSGIRRQRLHHQIATTLEQVYAGHLAEHTMEIAHHLIRAGPVATPDKVVAYARQAGDQACRAFAWGEAGRYYEAALATDRLSPHEQAALHYRAGLAYHRDQDVGPCLHHYSQALEGYRMAGDVQGLAQVLMLQTELQYSLTSVPLGTLADVSPLEDMLEALGDSAPGLRGGILNIMALAYRHARQAATAQCMATQALEIGRHLQADDLCARASNTLAQTQIHNLQVRESVQSYQDAVASARRLGDLWLQGLPLQRIPLSLIMLGQLEAAETAALEACHLAQTTQDWGNYSLPLAHLTYIHVARGAFQAGQHYAQEALRLAVRSGYPWGGTRVLFAQACMYTFQGDWTAAEQQLDMLIEPGRMSRETSPVIKVAVEVLRGLIRAYAGRVDGDLTTLVTALRQDVEMDMYVLAPCCALVEWSDLTATPAVAEWPAQVLAYVAERDVLFTPEWVFLIPRVRGLAAMMRGAWDEAETCFHTAIATALRTRTQSELGRAYLDYARMLVARNQANDRFRAQELLAQAEPICQALDMQPWVQRIGQLTRSLRDAAAPARLSQRETAVLLRSGQSSTHFLS